MEPSKKTQKAGNGEDKSVSSNGNLRGGRRERHISAMKYVRMSQLDEKYGQGESQMKQKIS